MEKVLKSTRGSSIMFSHQGLNKWYKDKNLPLQHKLFRYLDDNGNEIDSASFAELDKDARRVASFLINVKKLKAGDRALLMYTPGLDFLRVFMGAIYAGVTVVTAMPPLPNNFAYSMGAAIKIITDSGSSICLASNLVLKMIKMQLLLRHRKLNQHLPKDFEWVDYSAAVGHKDENFTEPDITPDSTLMLQYSSGSTGDPKGIILTHENIYHNCTQIFNFTGALPSSSGLSWLPMYHDMGLIGHFFTPLLVAGTQWLISPLSFLKRPAIWLELVSKLKIGFSGGPNFAYSLLAEKFSDAKFYSKDFDLSSWTMAFCGAEPINPLTLKKFSTAFAKFGFKEQSFYPVYGLGEATLLVTYPRREAKTVPTCLTVSRSEMTENKRVEMKTMNSDDALEIIGLGAPETETQLLIVNPKTKLPARDGEVGEIWVKNKSVAKGYWNKKALTDETFRNFTADNRGPFMRTGDLGFMQRGELFFASRNKDLVIISGANHWPQDIESTVERAHSLLRKGCCAAFAVSSESSEELCVVAEVKKGVHISNNSLHAIRRAIKLAVQTNHSLALSDDHLILVSAGKVPKTTSGKIRRSTCRDRLLNQELKPYRPKNSHWPRTVLITSAVALLAMWKFSPVEVSTWFYVAVLVFMALIVPAVGYVKGIVRHYQKKKEFNAAHTSKATEIERFIVESLKSNAGITITDLHKPLAEYGLKSIDVALAVGELERYLEQDISPTCFYECKNIKELASYLALKNIEQSTLAAGPAKSTTSARAQKAVHKNQLAVQQSASTAAYVLAMGKAVPENYFPQQVSARALIESSTIPAKQPEMVEKIIKFFTANGIEGRHMVLSLDELTKLGSTEHRNEYYVREAPKLAVVAARQAIANWGRDMKEITHVISVSCTGTIVPGLEFHIMDALGLNKSVARLGVNFMGCFGGLTALRTASEIARASPNHRVLVVCTELCSLHVQKDDARIDNLIAESLFGDGAAALIMGSNPRAAEEPKYEVVSCISGALEGSMEQIRWDLSDSGWKVGLESQISKLLGGNIEPFAAQLMKDQKSSEITWAIHPGGKAIISTIEEKLSIPKERTKSTWEVYNKFGNVSSGTVYFVLENILNKHRETPVDTCQDVVSLAFGPGLAMEGARLKLCTQSFEA